jgi:RNA polymerase sigma-70 factor (family 1)
LDNYKTYSDEQLLELLKTDDEKAFETLYSRFWKPLYFSAFQILGDRDICKDIIQELFVDIWQRREYLEIKTSLKGYLFTAVKYRVFKEIRNSSNNELFEDLDVKVSSWTGDSKMLISEIEKIVNLTVSSLPEGCKQVYTLSRDHDLTHAEIGLQLGISTKTVANQLTKALRQIRNSLGQLLATFFLFFFN